MGLSMKFALLTSLGFIGGMCWLVNQAAKPVVNAQGDLAQRPPAVSSPERVRGRAATARLTTASPVETALASERPRSDELLTVSAVTRAANTEAALPPIARQAAADKPVPGVGYLVAVNAQELPTLAPTKQDEELRPVGSAAETVRTPEPATATAANDARKYVVQKGDTLTRVARRALGSESPDAMKALLAANPAVAKRKGMLLAGESLNLPAAPAEATVAAAKPAPPAKTKPVPAPNAGKPKPVADTAVVATKPESKPSKAMQKPTTTATTAKRPAKETTVASATPRRAESGANAKRPAGWYTIRKGDTLSAIARNVLKDERRWREIARLNAVSKDTKLAAGSRLKLPPAESGT